MSEGVRKRTAGSRTRCSDHAQEQNSDVTVVHKRQQRRSLLLSLVLGLISFFWAFVKIVLGAVTLCYIACVILMYSSPAARELIIYLHPLKNPFHNLSDPISFGLPVNTVHFYIDGSAGKLGAWDIPSVHSPEIKDSSQANEHSHLKDGRPVILYLHGNAHTRGEDCRVQLCKLFSSWGYHAITIDYRGFGDSDGTPSENGLIDDGAIAMAWIRSQISNSSVYIWGHSLGTGVAGGVAKILCDEGFPPSGVILEAPFNNLREGAASHILTVPFRFLPYFNETVLDEVEDVFRTDKRLADVYCPILILHDREDNTVPIELGKKDVVLMLSSRNLHKKSSELYSSAKSSRRPDADPIEFIEFVGYGHHDIYQSERLPGILRDFIKT